MLYLPKFSVQFPDDAKPDKYFSIRLKARLSNENAVFKPARKMLVISNIEGNFRVFRKMLINCGVISIKHEWLFEEGNLIITGNCIENNRQLVECLWLIYSLEERAKRKGGYVHFILGNYEISNLHGAWRNEQPRYAPKTRSGKPPTALYDGNNTLFFWLKTKNIMEKIGHILFVHGGIAPAVMELPLSIHEINQVARTCYSNPGYSHKDKTAGILYHEESAPFSFSGYYDALTSEVQIDQSLSKFGINHIITGYNNRSKITAFFNGKLINVTICNNKGTYEALLIEGEIFYRVSSKGIKKQIWPLS